MADGSTLTLDPDATPESAPSGDPATRHHECTADRRVAIAHAARAIIVEKGLEGLRTREVAARVGINVATLHYHVPSKKALITLVAESAKAEFMAQNAKNPRRGMSPRQRLRQEIDDFLDMIENRRELLLVMAEFSERSRRDPVVEKVLRSMHTPWLAEIRDILADGAADGTFRANMNVDAAALVFVSALIGSPKLLPSSDPDNQERFAELERSFLQPTKFNA